MMTSCGREWKKLRRPVKVSNTSCTVCMVCDSYVLSNAVGSVWFK